MDKAPIKLMLQVRSNDELAVPGFLTLRFIACNAISFKF